MSSMKDLLQKIAVFEDTQASNATANTTGGPTNMGAPTAASTAASAPDDFDAKMKNYEANKSKAAAIEQVKKYMSKPINQIGRLENLINPQDGFIYYGEAGLDAFKGNPRKMPYNFMAQGDQNALSQAIKAAGLEVTNNGGYAYIDPKALASLGQQPAPVTAPVTTPVKGTADQPVANADMQKKIDRLKTILGTNVTKESIFKSSIAKMLSEEFNIEEDTAATPPGANARQEADALWAEIQQAMNTPGALTPEQRKDVENMTQPFQQYQQNNPLPGKTTTTTPPKSNLAKPVPGVKEIQDYLNSLGMTDNAGAKLKPDGVWGHRSNEAKRKFDAKFPTGSAEDNKYLQLLQKVPKDQWYVMVPDAKGTPSKVNLGTKNPAPAAPTDSVNKGTGNMPAPTNAEAPAAGGIKPPAQLTQLVPNPQEGQKYWVDGNRWVYRAPRAGSGGPHGTQPQAGGWTHDYGNLNPATQGGITRSWVSTRAGAKYTGPDGQGLYGTNPEQPAEPAKVAESGYSEDPTLARIISLAGR